MGKGAVADDADDRPMGLALPGELETMGHRNGSAHIDGRVHAGKRRQGAQGVAADIARHDAFGTGQFFEDRPMGAAGAQGRRSAREVGRGLAGCGNLLAESEGDGARRKLPRFGERMGEGGHRHARSLDVEGKVIGRLVDDVDRVDRVGEGMEELFRQRP